MQKPCDVSLKLSGVFSGREHFISKDLLVLNGLTVFAQAVLESVGEIPMGSTETYGGIALKIGRPGAARAVGGVLAGNPFPLIIPCHRVVAVSSQGGYQGGMEMKLFLLAKERESCQRNQNVLL